MDELTKEQKVTVKDTEWLILWRIHCPRCSGTGRIYPFTLERREEEQCWRCKGTGKRAKVIDV